MLNSKQRARLRGLANGLEDIVQIGKSGLTPEVTKSVDEALEARELIKINIQKNCAQEISEISDILCGRTHSEPVQAIGSKLVLYRRNKKKPIIDIPPAK